MRWPTSPGLRCYWLCALWLGAAAPAVQSPLSSRDARGSSTRDRGVAAAGTAAALRRFLVPRSRAGQAAEPWSCHNDSAVAAPARGPGGRWAVTILIQQPGASDLLFVTAEAPDRRCTVRFQACLAICKQGLPDFPLEACARGVHGAFQTRHISNRVYSQIGQEAWVLHNLYGAEWPTTREVFHPAVHRKRYYGSWCAAARYPCGRARCCVPPSTYYVVVGASRWSALLAPHRDRAAYLAAANNKPPPSLERYARTPLCMYSRE